MAEDSTAMAGVYTGLFLTEAYDAFGNRESQTPSGTYGGTVPQPSPVTFTGVNNHNNPGVNNNTVDQWSYDTAGDVSNDGTNMYEYDAEGRQTGTLNSLTGLTGYVYDAEGRRAMKVVVNGFGGPHPTTTVQNEYLLGLNGEQVTVLDGNNNWQWTNVYANGKVLATYSLTGGTQFPLTDQVGTKRFQIGVTGPSTVAVTEQCLSLPYGDGLDCTGTDSNQLHFTGKERDTESTNDYFLARYYAGNIAGRFLTPDWASKAEPVPYAKLDNPQSLNLYAYVSNNPITGFDVDGHCGVGTGDAQVIQRAGGGIIEVKAPCKSLPINPNNPYQFYTYTFLHIPESGGSGGGSSAGSQNAKIGPMQVPPVTVGPSNDGLKIQDCLKQAISGAMQDLTGISLLKDIAAAGATGSFAPFMTPGYAAAGAEHGADAVAGSAGARAAIRTALRQEGIKVSTKAVGKEASVFGKGLGYLGLGITADSAYEAYKRCMEQ